MQENLARNYFKNKAASYKKKMSQPPWCWLRAFEAWRLFQILPDIRGMNVIDAFCGTGDYAERLLDRGASHCTAVDITEEMLLYIENPRITPCHGDFSELSWRAEKDLVVCAGGLEFSDDLRAVFSAASRATHSNGRFLILYPPPGFGGFLYSLYHRRKGLNIFLHCIKLIHKSAENEGWRLKKETRIHFFANGAYYEKA